MHALEEEGRNLTQIDIDQETRPSRKRAIVLVHGFGGSIRTSATRRTPLMRLARTGLSTPR